MELQIVAERHYNNYGMERLDFRVVKDIGEDNIDFCWYENGNTELDFISLNLKDAFMLAEYIMKLKEYKL